MHDVQALADLLADPRLNAHWFRTDLSQAAREAARSETLLDTGWFDAKALCRLAEDHIAGRRDHARELWQLLMLERNVSLLSNN